MLIADFFMMQRSCKANAERQACLNVLLSRSLSYAKIVQGECRTSSLLERYAEPQPILCKDKIIRDNSQ